MHRHSRAPRRRSEWPADPADRKQRPDIVRRRRGPRAAPPGSLRETERSPLARIFLAVHLLLAVTVLTAPDPLAGQATGTVVGTVTSAAEGSPLDGAVVRVEGTEIGAIAGPDGAFRLRGVPAGERTLSVEAAGHRRVTRVIRVTSGQTVQVRIALPVRPLDVGGIEVSVLRPDMQPEAGLEARQVREANPEDSGELLRELPGVSAVRRGPLGLDPQVRGLRETEVGTYLDGTRMFPAGPARMDSPLTHLDPSAIQDIQVVKGPYALTWGAGNLSAVRVQTEELPASEGVRGRMAAGYDTNRDAVETVGTVAGRSGDVSYWVHGVWRDGDDYESGAGTEIPGDYRSAEGRAKVGVDLSEDGRLVFGGGYQDQGPIDYPGRLLTAKLFETVNVNGRYELDRDRGTLRSLEVMGYHNDVHHEMDNSGKPTAVPMPGRIPPFALDVFVDADVAVTGGRVDAKLVPAGGWELQLGGDLYSVNRDAVRTIRRAEDDRLLFEDLMWPDARITDGGLYGRVTRQLNGRIRVAGTVRLDLVEATADSVSPFLRENTSGDFDQTETNLSGAFTVAVDVSDHWAVSAGLGSAVRTADATERYSDRIPATKAQTSAEFVGEPGLAPERSNQADLWIEGAYERFTASANVFGRTVDDYITIEATDLEKRLPLSPDTVFRYVNGEADFWGFEATAAYALSEAFTADASVAHLWGQDERLDEPVLGIEPWRGSLGLRWEDPDGRAFLATGATAVAEQERVAELRGEEPTVGYVTFSARGGVQLYRGLNLRAGVENLADRDYTNHLNAKNPFTGTQIPEPGRVVFVDLIWEF